MIRFFFSGGAKKEMRGLKAWGLLIVMALFTTSALGEGIIVTVAGNGVGDGVPARQAWLNFPSSAAVDSAGNIYISDTLNHRVRKIAPNGIITTVAGTGVEGFDGDGGPAVLAKLSRPTGLAVDSQGNLYIADTGNNRIRVVTPDGQITSLNLVGPKSDLNSPYGVAIGPGGSVYIADTFNHRVLRAQRVVSAFFISVVAGTGTPGFGGDNGPATKALLNLPFGIAVDSARNIYIADSENHRIRRVSGGTITTIAGTGQPGFAGDGGPGTAARLNRPLGLALDAAGNLYIADSLNLRIRRLSSNGTITTVAGIGARGFGGDGGPATQARFAGLLGIFVDQQNNLYIPDRENHRLRRVTPTGVIDTIAGTGFSGFIAGGQPANQSVLVFPSDVEAPSRDVFYIADTGNHRVERVNPDGTLTVLAGTGEPGFSGDGGPANQAQLTLPADVAVDQQGNVYIADLGNNRVRRVTPQGQISTIAGGGTASPGDGGLATQAILNGPGGVAVDNRGNLFISEKNGHRVRKVDLATGIITTVAGTGVAGFNGDNIKATEAQLDGPTGLAVDGAGNLYIADSNNQRIRKVAPDGMITTVAGIGFPGFGGDQGFATRATLNNPFGVSVDRAGNLYIADTDNHRIRRIGKDGRIITIAGTGEPGFAGDGGTSTKAKLTTPEGLSVDPDGNIYIADTGNNRIRKILAAIRILCGDANGDGQVNFADATLGLRIATGRAEPTDAQLAALDLNGDGRVTIPEVGKLIKRAADPNFLLIGPSCLPTLETPVCGDLNGDGRVTTADVTIALAALAGRATLTPRQFVALDLNGNGRVDSSEVKQILIKATNPDVPLIGKNCQ